MKTYKIVINGTAYEVEIEEIDAATAKASAPAKAAAPAVSAPAGGETVTAPIPGNVLKIVAEDGSMVKTGDVLIILESMKMENDVVAPVDGKVTYSVARGAKINAGDVICTIA